METSLKSVSIQFILNFKRYFGSKMEISSQKWSNKILKSLRKNQLPRKESILHLIKLNKTKTKISFYAKDPWTLLKKKKKKSINSMQQQSLQSGSSSGEFQCRLRSRACALFAGFFPCRRTSDPFSSQYLVSYCRDVEGLSRRRHSSLVPVRRNNEWTILLRPSPPLAPLESVHSFVCRPLTFLILIIRSNRIRGKISGSNRIPSQYRNANESSRGDRQGCEDAENREGWLERIKKTAHEQ